MFDSVTPARLPRDAKLVGAYTDGPYANEAAVRAQCPHATVVRITAHGLSGAHVADCETGDLTPAQAARWAHAEVRAGRQPTIYMNASTWPSVKQAVHAEGIDGQVCYWVAHYDNDPTIPAGAVAKQYIERTDQNLDYSTAADYWPGVDPPQGDAVTLEDLKKIQAMIDASEARLYERLHGDHVIMLHGDNAGHVNSIDSIAKQVGVPQT